MTPGNIIIIFLFYITIYIYIFVFTIFNSYIELEETLQMRINNDMLLTRFILLILLASYIQIIARDEEEMPDLPPQFRMIRVYGDDNELNPPIVVIQRGKFSGNPGIGSKSVTIEFDVDASVPPSIYVKFVHCDVNWNEDGNIFLNDITMNRTSNIKWEKAPMLARFYSYRGFVTAPNNQIKFNYGGNWKALFYLFDDDSKPIAEAKFFVVLPKAECEVAVYSDMYRPDFSVSPSAHNLEAIVYSSENLMDNNISTAVIYRNNRWNEPYIISQDSRVDKKEELFKYRYKSFVGGFASVQKRFRIERIPVETTYRVLPMTDLGLFPRTSATIRLPLSDLRRSGGFWDYDDDGSMVTTFVTHSDDDYLNLEFLMDPDGPESREDVFISGSFNNWTPDINWQMYYDEEMGYYRLRQWVRRARHNYMYATGKLDLASGSVRNISFEEFEGNNSSVTHTYIAFIYYREFDYGGYDSIIAVGAGNIYGNIRN